MRLTQRGRQVRTAVLAGAVVLLATGLVQVSDTDGDPAGTASGAGRKGSGAVGAVSAPAAGATSEPVAKPVATPVLPQGLTRADLAAGVLAAEVPRAGSGRLEVVPGEEPAPGPGTPRRVRVEVEGGLPVDAEAFAATVMTALNDPRGWGRAEGISFTRTAGDADHRVVLASPSLTDRLCHPLRTRGVLSCASGDAAVLTLHRWVGGTQEYREQADLSAYRSYVVNHEVGHLLGYRHVPCPGRGEPAPVMQQQTKGLDGCLPNPWPAP